jgi:hypothetical protein
MSILLPSQFMITSNQTIYDPAIFNSDITINNSITMHRYKESDIPSHITSRIAPYNIDRFLYSVSLIIHEKNIDSCDINSVWSRLPIYLTREDFEYLKPKEGENIVEIWFNLVFAAVDFINHSKS